MTYTLDAGRIILGPNGAKLAGITRLGMTPTDADDFARALVDLLNAREAAKAGNTGTPTDYLARFPEAHRETADSAYQDGFADGADTQDLGHASVRDAADKLLEAGGWHDDGTWNYEPVGDANLVTQLADAILAAGDA